MVNVTVTTESGALANFDVDSDATVSNLRLLIEAELGIASDLQELRYNGHKVRSSGGRTVRDAGIEEGSLILVKLKGSGKGGGVSGSSGSSGSSSNHGGNIVGSSGGGSSGGGSIEVAPQQQQVRPYRKKGAVYPSSLFDGSQGSLMNTNQQIQIEEAIRRDNISQNLEAAIEHNPEAFGSVYMLYVNAKINGRPVKAFVDTGAQTTILSKRCAERCGIYRLLDQRFAGIARGIGVAKILGRIHMALLTLGNEVLMCSFTIMEDPSIELLLGLDMLKKHRAHVDLDNDCLRVHHSSIPFLHEKDIPKLFDGLFPGGAAHPGKRLGHAMNGSPSASNQASSSKSPRLAAGPSSSNQSSSSSSSGKYPRETVKKLTQLGFSKEEVIQALDLCSGNEDFAANYLTQSKYGF